jgi:hypothetical protein
MIKNNCTVVTNHPSRSYRKLPINILKMDIPLFENELIKEIPESNIKRIANLLIIRNTIFTVFNRNLIESYSFIGKKTLKRRLTILLNYLNIFKKKNIIYKGAWAIDNLSTGYFHWIADVLPRIYSSKKYLDGYPVVLPASFRHKEYVTSSLNALDVNFHFIDNDGKLLIKDSLLISHLATTGNYNKKVLNGLKYFIQKSLLADSTKNSKRKIYISRANANKRKISNEEELISILNNKGFKIILAEDLSFTDQVLLFSEAEIILGLHGAGLVNMLFMKKNCYVIEIRRYDDSRNNCFFTLASELDLNYFYLLAEPEGENLHRDNCHVNLSQLSKVIDEVEILSNLA